MIEALYLHVPFCVARCAYCDFATSACKDDTRMDAYVDALCMQIRRAARAGLLGAVKTIYIGGGTPTHLGARRLNSLVYMISLSVNLENVVEFTVEANPESIDERMVADLFALGVNRFSIGAQSFDDAVLMGYGRVHDARQIEQAVSCVKTRTSNFSLDLMCGGPKQSMRSWEQSVQRALELGAQHVSVYPLTLEEGTPLFERVEAGECEVAEEDMQAQMMLRAEEVLKAAGLERYEVASYAKPGCESMHNSAYWTGVEYLGLGAGAASMLNAEDACAAFDAGLFDATEEQAQRYLRGRSGERPYREASSSLLVSGVRTSEVETQSGMADESARPIGAGSGGCGRAKARPYEPVPTSTPARFRMAVSTDDTAFSSSHGRPVVEVEVLTAREAKIEDLMLGMRMSSGVDRNQVHELPDALPVFEELCAKGLVTEKDGRFVPTERGWLMGNEVFGAIWGLAEQV